MRCATLLTAAGLALSAGVAAAEIPKPELPRVDPACVRANTPAPILAALVAAGLDRAASQKITTDNREALLRTAAACKVTTALAGERMGEVEEAIALQTFAAQALTAKFGVPAGGLDAAWDKLAPATRTSIWKLMLNKGVDVLTPEAKADVRAFFAATGVHPGEGAQDLLIYATSRSYLEALQAG